MKRLFPWTPALVLATGLAIWYSLRSGCEGRLRQQSGTHSPGDGGMISAESAVPSQAPTPAFPDKPLPPLEEKTVQLTTEEERQLLQGLVDSLMASETAVRGLSDSTFEKLQEKLAAFSPAQLAALVCSVSTNRDGIPRAQRDDQREMLENSVAFNAGELLSRQPPARVLAELDGLDLRDRAFLDRLINTIVGEMAKTDPAAAWSWVQRQPHLDEDTGSWARRAVLEAACGGDAFRWLQLVETCGRTGGMIPGGWITALDSPRFREAWLEKLIESRGADAAKDIQGFTTRLHDTQGFEAVRDFVDSHPSLPGRDSLILSIASSNLSGGGAAKADWLVSHSTPQTLAANTGELMKSWTAKDPIAAAAWLNAAPLDATWRDPALKAFAAGIAAHDAEAARTFAGRITDSTLRSETLRALEPQATAASAKASP